MQVKKDISQVKLVYSSDKLKIIQNFNIFLKNFLINKMYKE